MSKNTVLQDLTCNENQLTSLDLSKNVVLRGLSCRHNQLEEADLNALFNTLHGNTLEGITKRVSIGGNPGTATCDLIIAEDKGWNIDIELIY